MVTFDASLPGTSAGDWSADPRLHNRPALNLAGADELVVIAAHPDDETLGAGGLIAHCTQLGMAVRVICVTDGAASHADDESIAGIRANEFRSALHELAPHARLEMLGFDDGQTREQRADIVGALTTCFATVSNQAVIAVTWRGDGHRDHRIVGEIVSELARDRLLLEYPIWMWHWADPQHPAVPWNQIVSLGIDRELKAGALNQYSSQTTGENPVLRPDFLEHAQRETEFFIANNHVLGQDYFDTLYTKSEDPWRFRTRWYEQRKREITIASLPHQNYPRALEIGCSIGLLTDLLAPRCGELLALDLSLDAVTQAQQLVGSHASVRCQDVLKDFPAGKFDLVVLSEVGYYWTVESLRSVLSSIAQSLTPEGIILACHWRHPVAEYPLSGDEVHATIEQHKWTRLVSHNEEDFTLEVFGKDPRSVAQLEGLA